MRKKIRVAIQNFCLFSELDVPLERLSRCKSTSSRSRPDERTTILYLASSQCEVHIKRHRNREKFLKMRVFSEMPGVMLRGFFFPPAVFLSLHFIQTHLCCLCFVWVQVTQTRVDCSDPPGAPRWPFIVSLRSEIWGIRQLTPPREGGGGGENLVPCEPEGSILSFTNEDA